MDRFIFTKHALQRLSERSISMDAAHSVLRSPDETLPGKKPDTVKFVRTLHGRNIQLVGTYLKDQKQWLILSAWVRGEDDPVPLSWQVFSLPLRILGVFFKAVILLFKSLFRALFLGKSRNNKYK